MFSGASLSNGTSIDGGSHGARGKGENYKRDETSRLYRLGEECISEVRDLGDLGSRTRTGLLSLGFGWPANLPAED